MAKFWVLSYCGTKSPKHIHRTLFPASNRSQLTFQRCQILLQKIVSLLTVLSACRRKFSLLFKMHLRNYSQGIADCKHKITLTICLKRMLSSRVVIYPGQRAWEECYLFPKLGWLIAWEACSEKENGYSSNLLERMLLKN